MMEAMGYVSSEEASSPRVVPFGASYVKPTVTLIFMSLMIGSVVSAAGAVLCAPVVAGE
jgi:hypothetical protein